MKPKLALVINTALILFAMLTVAFTPRVTAHTEADPFVTDLIAGQHYDVGDVSVWNDGDYLYVKYETTGSWSLMLTHLHVATSLSGIPQKNGNPPPGQFDYQMNHAPSTNEYTYAIDLDWTPSTQLYIAAHADVCGFDGDPMPAEGLLATVPLYAYRDMEIVGTVQVVLDGDNLVVTFETVGGWKMLESYLYIGLVEPTTLPDYRTFAYQHPILAEVTTDAYVVPLADVGVGCGDTIYISGMTYAKLQNAMGTWYNFCWTDEYPFDGWTKYFSVEIVCEYTCETAWADGLDFPGRNWAMYFTYTVQ